MSKYLFISGLCICCFVANGQIDIRSIPKNKCRYDCSILQAAFKDTNVFNRRNWGRGNGPVILNNFNHYFETCAIAPLFGRQVVVVNKELKQRSDTLAILSVTKKEATYTIDFFQPSTGNDCQVDLVRTDNVFKVAIVRSGGY